MVVSSTIETDESGGEYRCSYRKGFKSFMANVRPWIAVALYAFIPIVTVFLLNVLIIFRLIKVKRATEGRVGPMPATSAGGPPDTTLGNTKTSLSSMNGMFLSVSIVFLILLTPGILHYATRNYWAKSPEQLAASILLTAVFETLSYSNYCINFFLYCLTGRRFRREFLALFTKGKTLITHRGQHAHSLISYRGDIAMSSAFHS